ncbi:HNH endonuclease [Ruminiclostridium josui]|uniref:HNH endonuclease n=1 Tax=Ruminiclostridium josui TaxID=1499 RepID=UPI0004659494|nr:HNH endonuclease [Ruminiclostridium josui]
MKKEIRQAVHRKYDGHCAYCGKEIAIKDMQVDHIEPQRNWDKSKTREEINSFENLNPSCRRCNHYKRADNLEAFRETMLTLHKRISDIYIVKVAIDHGIVNIKPFDGKFYFERVV